MTTPALVLFDLDGVLVHYDRERRVRHLGAALGRDPAQVFAMLFESGLESRYDGGELGTDAYLDALGSALGCHVDRATWTAARGAAMRVDAQTLRLLDNAARHCELAILTNNGPLLGEVLPLALPALFPRFEGRVLCSGDLGAAKPAARAYLAALERLGHVPARVLFLDDNAGNVAGARAAGLRAECVPAPGQFADILADYGLA